MNEHLALDAFYLEHPGRRGEWESSVEDDRVWMTGSSVLDQRGQLLRAALGFAGLPRPSYDRSLHALRTWLDSRSGIRRVAVGMARRGYEPPDHPLRREGLAGHVLYERDGALAHECGGLRVGADAGAAVHGAAAEALRTAGD